VGISIEVCHGRKDCGRSRPEPDVLVLFLYSIEFRRHLVDTGFRDGRAFCQRLGRAELLRQSKRVSALLDLR
jgi:hypothetical protein